MAYGLRTYDDSNGVVFDSEAFAGGWVAGVEIGGTTGRYVSYPDYAGRTGYTVVVGTFYGTVSWDYTLGYPRVFIPGSAYADQYRYGFVNFVK